MCHLTTDIRMTLTLDEIVMFFLFYICINQNVEGLMILNYIYYYFYFR